MVFVAYCFFPVAGFLPTNAQISHDCFPRWQIDPATPAIIANRMGKSGDLDGQLAVRGRLATQEMASDLRLVLRPRQDSNLRHTV
jgi:hypothetical protein